MRLAGSVRASPLRWTIAALFLLPTLVPVGLGGGSPAAPVDLGHPALPRAPASALSHPAVAPDFWKNVTGSTKPPDANNALAYDPAYHGDIMFTSAGATWLFRNGTWKNLTSTISGAPSSNRGGPAMAYDPIDGYLVLYGGQHNGEFNYNDTWILRNNTWKNITSWSVSAPSPRFETRMVWDATDGYVLLFSGVQGGINNSADSQTADTWKFLGGNWTNITSSAGTPPPGRDFYQIDYDPSLKAVVLFGGYNESYQYLYGDTWTFSGGTWTNVTPSGYSPPPLRAGCFFYDPHLEEDLLVEGTPVYRLGSSDGIYAYAHGLWSNVTGVTSTAPGPRAFSVCAPVDPDGNSTVLYGGLNVNAAGLQDTWIYNATALNVSLSGSAHEVGAHATMHFTVTATGGYGGYTLDYHGLPTGCRSANETSLSCVPSASGTFNVSVTVTDLSGADATAGPYEVVVETFSSAAATNRSAADVGQTVQFNVTLSGGTPNFEYAWSHLPNGTCSSPDLPVVNCTVTLAGTYHPEVSVTDAIGAVANASTELLVYATPSVQAGASWLNNTLLGSGVTVDFVAAGSGGAPPGTYAWLFGDGTSGIGADPSHLYTAAGNFTAEVWYNDSVGESASATVAVVVHARPGPLTATVAVLPASATLDLKQSLVLYVNATGGFPAYTLSYDGLPPGCHGANVSVIRCVPTQSGQYSIGIGIEDSNGSQIQKVVQLTVASDPTATATASATPECGAPYPATFYVTPVGGTPAYTASWTYGDGTTGSGLTSLHNYTAPGEYTVTATVTDAAGYVVTAETSVEVTQRNCTTTSPGGGSTGSGGGSTSSSLPGLDIALAIIAAAAVIGAVLWVRRPRPPAGDPGPGTPESGPDEPPVDPAPPT